MSSTSTPSSYAIALELGLYGMALLVLVVLWRAKQKSEIALMLTAMVFAGALELADIKSTHSYYYARFLVMFGRLPDWFPLAIAVAWALVLHTVMAVTARLPLSNLSRSLIAAPLATFLDLLLDPIVANARVVARFGEVCTSPGLPHGTAVGVGLWVWCVPAGAPHVLWGIPFANFYAWGVVVLGYTMVASLMRALFSGGTQSSDRFEFGVAIATGVVAFCVVDVALQLYTPIVMLGMPEWAMLAVVFGPGTFLLLRTGFVGIERMRVEGPILLSSYVFPPGALLYCIVAYLVSGIAVQAGAGMFVYVALATIACACTYAWLLLGRFYLWKMLGQYRAEHLSAREPSRASLLAPGPDRVSQQDLTRVISLRDPVLRNYMITQRYHDLSVELARVIDGPNANWCTFATWASGTAGESIREEEVPSAVIDLLRGEQRLERMLGELGRALGDEQPDLRALDVFAVARDTLTRVRNQVAAGNRKVFAELAPLFADFIDCFDAKDAVDATAFEQFMAGLRPGTSAEGGQDLLRRAFPAYVNASKEPNERLRAQWMLLGNCLIGLHEQTRLQSNIQSAMDAPVDVVVSEGLLARALDLMPRELRADFERLFGPANDLTLHVARAIWQHIATASAMHISLPDGERIPLGGDVDRALGRTVPSALREVEVAQLRELLARFRVDQREPFGLGALDWASLNQRMRFIIDLFRTTQLEVRLFEQPFAPAFQLELDARFAGASVRPRPISSDPAPARSK